MTPKDILAEWEAEAIHSKECSLISNFHDWDSRCLELIKLVRAKDDLFLKIDGLQTVEGSCENLFDESLTYAEEALALTDKIGVRE